MRAARTQRCAGELAMVREGPFVLLTPTGRACSAAVEQMLRERAAAHISLASVLEVVADGQNGGVFRAKESAAPAVASFVERVARSRQSGPVLTSIHREIAAVRTEFVELRTAKQRLEQMLAEGLFAFTKKVDATSFKVVCAILAEGDVAKASRGLGMPDASIRTLMRLDLVRWRKAVGRKETVPLNDNVMLGSTEPEEQPALIEDVLEQVTEMTGENWREKAEELEEILRTRLGSEH